MSPPERIAEAQGQDAVAGAGDLDALPGVAVPDHPDLRAGAFGYGNGVLGLYQTDNAEPSINQQGDPSYQLVNWRDTDPEAIAYDLDRKQRQLREAQTIGDVLGWGGNAQTMAGAAAKHAPSLGLSGVARALGKLADPEVGVAGMALGGYMTGVEAPRLQREIKNLKDHQSQLGRQRT